MTEREDILDLALREAVQSAEPSPPLPSPGNDEPDDELLLQVLDASATSETQARVEASPWARERLACLTEALTDAGVDASEPSPVNRFDDRVLGDEPRPVRLSFMLARGALRYLWGTLEPRSLEAVPVPTRSGTFKRPTEETTFFDFAHRIGDLDVVIQVERGRDDQLDVQLNFTGENQHLDRLRVTLADRQGSLLDSQPVEQGKTRFAALDPTPHDLLITSAQKELGRVRLDVHPG